MDFNIELVLPENAHRNARNRKAWKVKYARIIKGKVCCQCRKIHKKDNPLVIHHIDKSAYLAENYKLYESLSELLRFIVLCKKCHFGIHRGLLLCPVCKINYRKQEFPTCFQCRSLRRSLAKAHQKSKQKSYYIDKRLLKSWQISPPFSRLASLSYANPQKDFLF